MQVWGGQKKAAEAKQGRGKKVRPKKGHGGDHVIQGAIVEGGRVGWDREKTRDGFEKRQGGEAERAAAASEGRTSRRARNV